MATTPNHNYDVPQKGTANWHKPLNRNFKRFEVDIEVRDAQGNRGNYSPTSGAKFLATDTGHVYTGDGSNWNPTLAQYRYSAPSSSGAAGNLVAGHPANGVGSGVSGATITGGGSSAAPNSATGNYATVGGGRDNTASDKDATVGGGRDNTASLPSATVAGGASNEARDTNGTVGGGSGNVVAGASGTVAGGISNSVTVALGTVCGGRDNTASGGNAMVVGGEDNEAGGEYAFAAGHKATAAGDGTFVWGDSSTDGVTANKTDEFKVQAGGGAVIFSASDHSAGVNLKSGSGSWSAWSTRSAKTNVESIDPAEALVGVRALDISTWNYDGQHESIRHMGPMSEEFYEEFGLGGDKERIANVDADGVAFAAIQGLAMALDERDEKITEQQSTIDNQREQIDELAAENHALRERVDAIEQQVDRLAGDGADPEPADD